MGQANKRPGADGPFDQGHTSSQALVCQEEDDLFGGPGTSPLYWLADARILLNEALEKVPARERGTAHRKAQQQVEALARQVGVTEVTAELVGLALGGMSATTMDDG